MAFERHLHLVNLYGAVGSGKSTTAAGVFAKLKALRYSVNLVTEFSKELKNDHSMAIYDMPYIIGNQWHRIQQSFGFDVAIVDCPLPLLSVYCPKMDKECLDLIFALEQKIPSINYLLKRDFPMHYSFKGKSSSFLDAKNLNHNDAVEDMLNIRGIQYKTLKSNEAAIDAIVSDILSMHLN